MLNWKTLCQAIDLGSLVPDQFEEYRRPIADAMTFFLERLSPPRQAQLLADQLVLPADAAVELRLVTIARRCPILQKTGQLLSRDRRLPADLRQLLQRLESAEPTISGSDVAAMIRSELGDLQQLGIAIEDEPLAEASIAVVIPFEIGEPNQRRRGVFKLLKPNIERHLDEELAIMGEVGDFLDQRCLQYGIPEMDYRELFAQVRELLGNEVDLVTERENMKSAARVYADWPAVIVPELFPFGTSRLIAMERVDAQKVTDRNNRTSVDQRRIASRMIDALIACPIWSEQEDAIFHADPHAGNLLVTPDRRLVIIDWGLAGKLSKQNRIAVTQILIGALTLDQRRISRAIGDLADQGFDELALAGVITDSLRKVRRGKFPELNWLTELMDLAVTGANVRFTGDLLLFRKSLLMLDGVVSDVSEDYSTSTGLAASLTMRLGSDWRNRILSLPTTRTSSTHLSNADLLTLLGSGPRTSIRFWRGVLQDWINGAAESTKTAID